ncbi:MAG: hypothetical protein COU35_05065 [Candidatus Magasanikbacteria bacterium CG10_big_fil_rev_8_21_14_0_10_47_10]|uniref:Uncharacterized protein n=1 Tax=Candidatus Magasanikbacteria bacterium CG10_big_fil_rev_8_21_14_0_10_47_10 TaxID=1974652 RepID=A0A2H0TP83_9BACT|nr:MAG: hypothetical protein COU35_05065 [Candidatus Magasanikbacteria bacterium CG10_big_fil_rev_8_21_14_0_10_47_10]
MFRKTLTFMWGVLVFSFIMVSTMFPFIYAMDNLLGTRPVSFWLGIGSLSIFCMGAVGLPFEDMPASSGKEDLRLSLPTGRLRGLVRVLPPVVWCIGCFKILRGILKLISESIR